MASSTINFSGIASGIDSSSLIKAIIDSERQVRVTPLQEQITKLQDTNSSFSELKTRLTALSTAAAKFRVLNGSALSKQGVSSDETVATASASNAAMNGTYGVTVSQLATNATYSFKSSSGTYTSSSAKISDGASFSDTVTITVGNASSPVDSVSIDVDENTTLDNFVTEFNSKASGAVASVVNVGTSSSPDYRVVINTNKTGTAEGQIDVSVGATLTARGAFNQNTEDDAQNAIFSISGIGSNIERATNSVSDIFTGLTINLRGEGTTTLSIGDDSTSTTQTIQEFVDAYNDLVGYIAEHDTVTKDSDDEDAINVFGALASTSLDENMISAIRSAFSSAGISGGSVNTLADLGISTQRDGTLAFDTDAFNKAIDSDPESVRKITQNLGETLASVNGTIAQFTHYNGLLDQAMNANTSQVSSLQTQVSDAEDTLSSQEDSLTQRYARLESLMGQLNSTQSILTQLLPSS